MTASKESTLSKTQTGLKYNSEINTLIGKPIDGYLNFESDSGENMDGHCLDLKLDGKFQWRKSQCTSKNISHAFIAEAGK